MGNSIGQAYDEIYVVINCKNAYKHKAPIPNFY